MNVLFFVNRSTSTSIPLEIAAEIDESTDADVIVASFFEDDPSEFDDDVHEYGLRIVPLGAAHRLDLAAYRRLKRLVRSEDVDVLHTHHNSIGSIARALFSFSPVAIVNTEHRDHRSFSRLQRYVNFPTFVTVDTLVSNSYNTRSSLYSYERICARGADHQVVYNGVDLARIDQFRSVTRDENASSLQIVSVGRLVEIKDHECVLRSFSRVVADRSDVELLIVGDGPRRERLDQLATELGISEMVRFTGKVPRHRVYEILGQSDIFVVTSRSEGFCVAAVEAMACGLPVVASDIETLREVIGDVGTYASVGEPKSFAMAIEQLLDDDSLRNTLGEQGRQRVVDRFTLDRTAEEYYNIYKDVVKGSHQ